MVFGKFFTRLLNIDSLEGTACACASAQQKQLTWLSDTGHFTIPRAKSGNISRPKPVADVDANMAITNT